MVMVVGLGVYKCLGGNRSKNHKGKLMVGLQGGGVLQLFIYTI